MSLRQRWGETTTRYKMTQTKHTDPLTAEQGEGMQTPAGRTGFIAVFLRELHIIFTTPVYLICMFLLPMFVMVFFTSLMDQGQPNKMPVGIVDLDNTVTTRQLTRKLDAFQNTDVVAYYNSVDEARLAMQRNEIYGFMYFPKEPPTSCSPHVSPRSPSIIHTPHSRQAHCSTKTSRP